MISTRGRYAVRIMLDLAQRRGEGYQPIKEVATRQGISPKYLEKIMPSLTSAGFVEGLQGKGGGYRLCHEPGDYTVMKILLVAEGDMAPVSCLCKDAEPCKRAHSCPTASMWQGYYRLTTDYFEGITLEDLLKERDK